MKLYKNYLLQALLFIVAVVGMNSCSCNKETGIEDKIKVLVSDDVDMVITGDAARLLAALEIQDKDGTLELPDYLTELISETAGRRAVGQMEEGLSNIKGIDYTNSLFAARVHGERPDMIFAFNVTDVDDFYNSLVDIDEDFDLEEEGDYKVITESEKAIFLIKDGLAVALFKNARLMGSEKAVDELEKWKEKAQDKPLADWKLAYLKEPAVTNMWAGFEFAAKMNRGDFAEAQNMYAEMGGKGKIADMSMGIRFDLDGNSAKLGAVVFNSDGTSVSLPYAGKFDTNLLDYATANDYVAGSIALNDNAMQIMRKVVSDEVGKDVRYYRNMANEYGYDHYMYQYYMERAIEARAQSESIMTLVDAIEGNAMMAAGTRSDVALGEISMDNINDLHFVLAFNCKAGKAKDVYNTICTAVDAMTGNDSTYVANYGSSYNTRIRIDSRYDYNTYTYRDVYMGFYARVDGNTVILSNAPIEKAGGPNFDRNLFASSCMAVQFNAEKTSTLLGKYDLPCGFALNASLGTTATAEVTASLPGTYQLFVPALCKIFAAFMN